MSESTERPVRFYTRARKFPRLIGQTMDGRKLPGGPYTWTQLLATGAVLFLATRTAPLWARGSGLQTIMVIVFLTIGTLVMGRQLPHITRNPFLLLGGIVRVLLGPRHGRLRNRPMRPRRPHPVKGLCLIDQRDLPPQVDLDTPREMPADAAPLTDPAGAAALYPPASEDLPAPATPTTPVPLSRVAALLSQAVSGDRDA